MSRISPSKLIHNQVYQLDGIPHKFLGTKFEGSNKIDPPRNIFSHALNGDRWVFLDSNGKQVEYRKDYNAVGLPGLVLVSTYDNRKPGNTVRITQ